MRILNLMALLAVASAVCCQIYRTATPLDTVGTTTPSGIFFEEETGLIVYAVGYEFLMINKTNGERKTYQFDHSISGPFIVTHHIYYFFISGSDTYVGVFCLKELKLKKRVLVKGIHMPPTSTVFDSASSTAVLKFPNNGFESVKSVQLNIKTMSVKELDFSGATADPEGAEFAYDSKRRIAYTYSYNDQLEYSLAVIIFNDEGVSKVQLVPLEIGAAMRFSFAYNPSDSYLYVSILHARSTPSMIRVNTQNNDYAITSLPSEERTIGVFVDHTTNQSYFFSSKKGFLIMPNQDFNIAQQYEVAGVKRLTGPGLVVYNGTTPNAYVVDLSFNAMKLSAK